MTSAPSPRVSRREAVCNHPELLGAYWALDSAGKIADARIANSASRQRFISLVREALAHATERGEPLPAPPLRRTAEAVRRPEAALWSDSAKPLGRTR